VLTARGRDYLKAAAFTIIITSIAGPAIAGALSLSLAVMAAISLLLLRSRIQRSEITVEPLRLRVFKREARSAVLRVGSLGSDYARVSSASLSTSFGLDGEVGKLERGAAELTFRPAYAGLFRGIKVMVTVTDALGLFAQTQEVELPIVVESLPTALLLPDTPMLVSQMVQGEVPTGGRGSGQELYSIEPYEAGSDAKDVMWKRMARSGGDTMQVRVREASAKASVSMLLALGSKTEEERVKRVDLASEAVAQLGKKLVSLGVAIELTSPGRIATAPGASNVAELASAIAGVWSSTEEIGPSEGDMVQADLLVLGADELEDERMGRYLGRKPSLVVWDGPGRPGTSGRVFVFTGTEDLTQLVEVLLEV